MPTPVASPAPVATATPPPTTHISEVSVAVTVTAPPACTSTLSRVASVRDRIRLIDTEPAKAVVSP